LTSKETRFIEKLEIASKWTNMLMRKKILILKKVMSQFKLQENLIGLGQRKLILNPPKQKPLKIKGIFWSMKGLTNDKFFNMLRYLPFSRYIEFKVWNEFRERNNGFFSY